MEQPTITTIAISAVVGVISSIITAYVTTWFQIRQEAKKMNHEITLKFAEAHVKNKEEAQELAKQFAIGFLIIEDATAPDMKEKIFIPPNCRLTAGRSLDNEVITIGLTSSRKHAAITSDSEAVYIEDLSSLNDTIVNGNPIKKKTKLNDGDIVKLWREQTHVQETNVTGSPGRTLEFKKKFTA